MQGIRLLAAMLLAFSVQGAAGSKDANGPACEMGTQRPLVFRTTTGTAMNLDVSPDGRLLAFDLLGDIYVIPVSGGRARSVTSGSAWDVRPVWSPDGASIAFISDRDGTGDHAYVMEAADSGKVRQLTDGAVFPPDQSERVLRSVEWLPNSREIVVQGTYDAYRVSIEGTVRKSAQKISGSMGDRYHGNHSALYQFKSVSKVGDHVAIGVGEDAQGVWRYGPGGSPSQRLPMSIASLGNESPLISADERWVIYRTAAKPLAPHGDGSSPALPFEPTTIRAYNRRSGNDVLLIGPGTEPWPIDEYRGSLGSIRRFALSSDSKYLFVSYNGGIHRISLQTGKVKTIPFVVDVAQCMAARADHEFVLDDSAFRAKVIRSSSRRPDGKQLLFSAVRRVYVQEIPGGRATVLVHQAEAQFDPVYSPDGKWIAYATWSDLGEGHVWRVSASGKELRRLTSQPGHYSDLAWSPDGKMIAYIASRDAEKNPSGFWQNVYGGNIRVLTLRDLTQRQLEVSARVGNRLLFSDDGARVYYGGHKGSLERAMDILSVGLDGKDTRQEFIGNLPPQGGGIAGAASPDGAYLAAIKFGNLYLVYCDSISSNDAGVRKKAACKERRLTRYGAYDPKWAKGGAVLEWSFGNTNYQAQLSDLLRALQRDAPASEFDGLAVSAESDSVEVDLVIPRQATGGALVITGARIITMRGDEVLERGSIIVRNRRIEAVGDASDIAIPRGATVLDMTGKTIMPGLIDAHGHLSTLPRQSIPRNRWELLINLAFGVTTLKDPSNGGLHGYEYAELTDEGSAIGPRIFGTEALVTNTARIDSYQDAIDFAKRTKAIGGTFVKYHTGWNRQQRSWIFQAARVEGLNAAAHLPVSNYAPARINLTTIYDGATSSEHEITESEVLQADVQALLRQSGVIFNFSSVALNGGYAKSYWSGIKDDVRIRHFFKGVPPRSASGERPSDQKQLLPLEGAAEVNAKFLAEASRSGANVSVGSHGNYGGVGMHWEMWAYARGGMSTLDVLKAATINGARSLGMQKSIGSLEPGKIADLLILDMDPLVEIRNSVSIKSVMKDGVLRDAETLDEYWPMRKRLPEWDRDSYGTGLESGHH